jgi:hypothetical protein
MVLSNGGLPVISLLCIGRLWDYFCTIVLAFSFFIIYDAGRNSSHRGKAFCERLGCVGATLSLSQGFLSVNVAEKD